MTDNSSSPSDLQERNQQVLTDISQLQATEQSLYGSLSNAGLSSEQKQKILEEIGQISQMRLNMYENLRDMSTYYQDNVSDSRDTLAQQLVALRIVDNQLAENKAKMEAIESQKVDTLRLVEVNTYYSEYYATYKNLMLTIIFICVPIIILASLTRSGVIPQGLFGLLVAIIMIIGIVVLGRQIIDLSNRSNMVWDEYDWEFNTSEAPAATTTSSDDSSTDGTTTQMCTGEACCYENTTYDASSNMCIPTAMYDQDQEDAASTTSDDASTTSTSSTTSTATAATTTSAATATTTTATETFISNILGKYAWNSNDRNTTYLKHNTPKSSMPNTGLGGSPYNSNTV